MIENLVEERKHLKLMKTPRLYFNSSGEDIEAFWAMKKSGIPFEQRAAASDGLGLDETPTRPLLTVGYQYFVGIDEIQKYIEEYSENK